MRKNFVAGNWKMNLQPADAAALVRSIAEANDHPDFDEVEMIVCPPALYLPLALNNWQRGHRLPVGAQNCHWEPAGAFTGEISAQMLASVGVTHCIVGHSERRTLFGEDDATVQQKTTAILEAGLIAIVCCGETLAEREAGKAEEVVGRQLKTALKEVDEKSIENVIVAYEPVWAIGTGKTASSEQAQEMHAFIRTQLSGLFSNEIAGKISILYGGSCKPSNAQELFAQPDVDGGLIGGASLNVDDFLAIAESF